MNLKENYRVETSTSTSYFLSKLIDQIHTSYLHLLNKHTRNINTKVYRLSLVMLITFLNSKIITLIKIKILTLIKIIILILMKIIILTLIKIIISTLIKDKILIKIKKQLRNIGIVF